MQSAAQRASTERAVGSGRCTLDGAVTADGRRGVVDGRSTALRLLVEHPATYHRLVTADRRRPVVDRRAAAARPLRRRRFTDGRRPAAGGADGVVGAADVRAPVVDGVTAALGRRRRPRPQRPGVTAAQVRGRVVGGRRAGRRRHAAAVVRRPRTAVDRRAAQEPRTQLVAGAAQLIVDVVRRQAAASRPLAVRPASYRRPVAAHLP